MASLFALALAPVCAAQVAAPDCESAVVDYSKLNASQLFEAANACAQANRREDTNALLMLGQVKAMADMSILAPADETQEMKVANLYGQIYSTYGGLGFDDVYRDPQAVDRLAARVETASLDFAAGYDPGWTYKPTSKLDVYAAMIANQKQHRIWQMRNQALKLQNDAYYQASQAFGELKRKNRVFEVGTPAYDESVRLDDLMNKAAESVKELPPPPPDIKLYARMAEPDPDAPRVQVGQGFNGPAEQRIDIFRSVEEARASWLARAYAPADLAALLAKVDFKTQVLVSYSIGKRTNASGDIRMTTLRYIQRFQSYDVSVQVGVVPDTCGQPDADSYPFVLGVVAAVAGGEVQSRDMSNFPSKCGPPASGSPSAP